MKIRIILANLACRLSRRLLHLLGRGGTDYPGRIALKICPNLPGFLAKNVTTLIVTGTNGKTTVSRMIEESWRAAGISFFANRSGANLLSGVTTEFSIHSSLTGKCRYTHALIEADEAAFKFIGKFVDAKVVVVTNVFRDQLDRYGEVTHTLENIRLGIAQCPNAVVCLNADDSLCASLASEIKNPHVFYGVDTPVYASRVDELSDAPYCIRCKSEYVYDYVTYGHLGGYRCPHCGYARPKPDVSVTKILLSDEEHSEILLQSDGAEYAASVALPGGYNIYNACSCMAAAKALGLKPDVAAAALSSFTCGFGRMEKFRIRDTDVRMILIKNPAGCNQVLNFLTQRTQPFVFTACLNDRYQDGRDVSWIWDVDFERLCALNDLLSELWVSGDRAEDMALRFKYAGIPTEKIHICKSYKELCVGMTASRLPVFVMPTYTALLGLRGTISKVYGYREFWE